MPRQDDSFDKAKERLHKQFESATESQFDRERPESAELDENAVNGPGGDSRPDLVDPETAKFRDASSDPELTTSRENLPPVTKANDSESRKPEYSGIIGQPTGPEFSQEKAVVEDERHHEGVGEQVGQDNDQPVAEILDHEREQGGETGGMGRKNVPKEKGTTQGTWHDDPDAVTDNVPS